MGVRTLCYVRHDDCGGRSERRVPTRSEVTIHLAMTDLMAHYLTGEVTISWRDPTSPDQIRIPG